MSASSACLELLPVELLRVIAGYLTAEDIARLSQTCRRLRTSMPTFEVIRGVDFHIRGPAWGHWVPELYFDGPPLSRPVQRLTMSLMWVDQGWGNRKGEVYVVLVRDDSEIAMKSWLGVAPHKKETKRAELTNHRLVTEARPGDCYRFMRNAGGGGGHQLIVTNFKTIVEYK